MYKARMKALLGAAVISVAVCAAPVQAQDCGGSSFLVDEDGNCFDLDALSWLSKARASDAKVEREAIPFEFQLINLQPAPVLGGTVRGTVKLTNISQYSTIKTARASIIAANGSVWRPLIEVDLPPGAVHIEEVFFDASPGSYSAGGPFTSVYNPEIDRDLQGVGKLLDEQDDHWEKAWPYPRYEKTVCLVNEEQLAELNRTQCPRLETSAS